MPTSHRHHRHHLLLLQKQLLLLLLVLQQQELLLMILLLMLMLQQLITGPFTSSTHCRLTRKLVALSLEGSFHDLMNCAAGCHGCSGSCVRLGDLWSVAFVHPMELIWQFLLLKVGQDLAAQIARRYARASDVGAALPSDLPQSDKRVQFVGVATTSKEAADALTRTIWFRNCPEQCEQ